MRRFRENWGRTLTGIVAALLLFLNVLTAPMVFGNDTHDFGTPDIISHMTALEIDSAFTKDDPHQHSDTRECNGIACQFYVPMVNLPLVTVRNVEEVFPFSSDQLTKTDLASLFRPPRFIL